MKKKIIMVLSILILIALSILGTYYIKNLNTIKEIKKSFNEFVTTNKATNIYDEEKNNIGSRV